MSAPQDPVTPVFREPAASPEVPVSTGSGKAFKKAVRERMARTGEPYTLARRRLLEEQPGPGAGGAR